MNQKIKTALISVSDKKELLSIIKTLKKYKINIISSGGTYNSIRKMGFKCKEISEFTNFSEMLDGRVKTLHPKIHSGILFNRSKSKHRLQMKKNNFEPIDLVIVNFYPFKNTLKKTMNAKRIIENIDIGGPTMVRAAAKNFKDVVIITNRENYSNLILELQKNKGKTSLAFREKMAGEAFSVYPRVADFSCSHGCPKEQSRTVLRWQHFVQAPAAEPTRKKHSIWHCVAVIGVANATRSLTAVISKE